MSSHTSLDRESFQQLLAAAFAVQESRMDTQSLSTVIQIQRLIAAGDLDHDQAIHLIAEHTRNVSNAAGVAIGLLEGRKLVYRAGVGSAAPYIGRHVTATLSVSADPSTPREILRVENAQTDPRIEAAVCRQFGAESLLIIPIYQGQAVAGVLEVLFSEAHVFQEREVRAYRLMSGLVGDALSRAAGQVEHAVSAAEPSSVLPAIDQTAPQTQVTPGPVNSVPDAVESGNRQAIYQLCEVALAFAGKLPTFWRFPGVATMIRQQVNRVPLRIPQWSAVLAGIAVLVIVSWTAHGDRHAASVPHSSLKTPNFVDQPVASSPVKPSPVNASQSQTASSAAQPVKLARSAFKRVRIGENEIDYVADDVTVRHFTNLSSPGRAGARYNQVEFGKDVTVRYFASNPAVPVRPVASVAQPSNRALPESEKSVSPKLVR
jgi:hypothetical protein